MALPNIAQQGHKIEAYGEVVPGPGTVQLIITFPPGSEPLEIEMCRAVISEALKKVVKTTNLAPMTEQKLYT